jgi:hypothetical protein
MSSENNLLVDMGCRFRTGSPLYLESPMSRGALFLTVVAIVPLLGCGRRSFPANPKTVAVKGRVLLANGKPLDGGRLTFHNKDTSKPIEGHAELEPNGTFQASMYGQDDGLVPGTYVITISPNSYRGKAPKQVNAGVIPKKYQKKDTSTLEIEVKEGEEKLPDLVLK